MVHCSLENGINEVVVLSDKLHKDKGEAIHTAWAGIVKGNGKEATKRAYQATPNPVEIGSRPSW